jgi:hypothetical protein
MQWARNLDLADSLDMWHSTVQRHDELAKFANGLDPPGFDRHDLVSHRLLSPLQPLNERRWDFVADDHDAQHTILPQ